MRFPTLPNDWRNMIQLTIHTTESAPMIGEEGLCVGRDSGEPVTEDYPGTKPYRFTRGTISRVAIDVSGEPYVDLEREAVASMMRV
jgi:hypothetical protein